MKAYFRMRKRYLGVNASNGKMEYVFYPTEYEKRREYCCKPLYNFSYDILMNLKERLEISTEHGNIELNYCPNCGQKVELIQEADEEVILER